MKKFAYWLGFALLVAFAAVMPAVLDGYFVGEAPSESTATVLTAWHIDTFEGGIGSRQEFLMKSAVEFERENNGVYILVVKHTEESVRDNFDRGVYPDIISFGNGVDGVINYAKPLKTQLNNPFFSSATVGGKVYFYPYAYGVYALFTANGGKGEGLVVSKGQNNLPLFLAAKEGLSAGAIRQPLNAYTEFVGGRYSSLLGTQRDAYRLLRRGVEFSVEGYTGFTDLVQYVAVTSADPARAEASMRFAEFLISERTQSRLGEIGLFSPVGVKVDYGEEQVNYLSECLPRGVLSAVIDTVEREILFSNDGEKEFFEKFEEYVRY